MEERGPFQTGDILGGRVQLDGGAICGDSQANPRRSWLKVLS